MRDRRVRWILAWLSLVTAFLPSPTRAQADPGGPSLLARDAVVVQASLEPELVVSIGYLRRVAAEGNRAFHAGVGLKFPLYLVGRGSGRIDLLARGRWIGEGGFGVAATTSVYLARSRNRAGVMHGLGIEGRAAPGYHGASWSLTADLGWQRTFLAHLDHSDLVGETFKDRHPGASAAEGPIDGWYRGTAERFRIGVAGARRVADGLSIRLAAGSLFSIQRQGLLVSFAHAQVPAYVELSATTGW